MDVVVFVVAGLRLGLDADAIVDVLPAVPLRPLPGAPPSVAGLLELNRRLLPVFDARPPSHEPTHLLVIAHAHGHLALRVEGAPARVTLSPMLLDEASRDNYGTLIR